MIYPLTNNIMPPMDFTDQVLTSTLLLTALLLVGLVSFLRSSIKDRTMEILLPCPEHGADQLLSQSKAHLHRRGYQVIKLDPAQETVTLAGRVRPSIFLAGVLVTVAAMGMGCLGLVLTTLVPFFSWLMIAEIAFFSAIGAGLFYWHGADRIEEVSLQLRPSGQLWIKGHKDELAAIASQLANYGEKSGLDH